MDRLLGGKIALVTGGSRGIGAAIVKAFVARRAKVAFSYASSAERAEALVKELRPLTSDVIAVRADQAIAGSVSAFVREAHTRFGGLDILVNNAGVSLSGKVAEAVREAVPLMRDHGRLINIGTVFASSSPFPGIANYSASKAAVAAYTRGWARDLGPRGITVNVVQPGPIDTEMNPHDSEFAKVLTPRTALARYGTAEEIAAAVVLLASPEASYITGATLDVDGEFNA